VIQHTFQTLPSEGYPSQNVTCFWYNELDTGFRTAGIFLVTQRSRGRGESPERPPRQGKEEFVVERYGNCSHLLFAGRIEDCVSRAAFEFRAAPPQEAFQPESLHSHYENYRHRDPDRHRLFYMAFSRLPGGGASALAFPKFTQESVCLAKLRVLLDEDIPDDLKYLFPKKTQVYTVAGLGLSGMEDRLVIEEAVHKRCLIVTANKDFVPEYRNHDWRKGKDERFFWGLIFLKASKSMTQSDQLKRGIKAINPRYDDIITVSATGHITRERIKGRDLKKKTAR